MSPRNTRIVWGAVLVLVSGICCVGLTDSGKTAKTEEKKKTEVKSPAPETLLPADAVLYIGADGSKAHQAEFEKTAAYDALHKSGLADAFKKTLRFALQNVDKKRNLADAFEKTYGIISGNGLSVAVAVKADVGPPKPWFLVVLHEGGELEPLIGGMLKQAAEGQAKFESKTISGRKVTRADIPVPPGAPFKPEFGWWKEGNHLVLAGGVDAVSEAIAVAGGKSPNITKNPLWKKYREAKADFAVASVSWLDLGKLRSMFGQMPVPGTRTPDNPAKVNDILAVLGLDNVGAIVSRTGYKGKATWSETVLEAKGEKKGLLSLISAKPVSLKELPPLPAKMTTMYAASVDVSKAYKTILEMVRQGAKLGPPGTAAKVEGGLDQLPAIIGIDPERDLFDTLGNVVCGYDDPAQGWFGIGSALVIKVKDEEKLRKTIDDLLQRAGDQAGPGNFKVVRVKKHGRTIVTAQLKQGGVLPSFTITDGWLCIASYPQAVEAFLLRLDKKLPVWKPTEEYQTAFKDVPQKYSSITTTDPRGLYRLLVGLIPPIYSVAQVATQQVGVKIGDLPVNLADWPPAEVVTQNLFPNVSVRTVDADGIHWTSRSSIAGIFGLDAVTVTAAAVAILLPAVQKAREAARKTTSKDNLHQMGIAMHNYHETYNHFPRGTIENKDLDPDERQSWMVSLLPFMDLPSLAEDFDKVKKKGWQDASVKKLTKPIPAYTIPGARGAATNSNYVGIAGVGADSLTTTKVTKKCGIFGYNRTTRFAQITDGLTYTIMIAEASGQYGPWSAGGPPTIRAFTKKPYVNGPDGIGSPFKGGFHVLAGDGAVHWLSDKTDPKVLEALSTMAGGERQQWP